MRLGGYLVWWYCTLFDLAILLLLGAFLAWLCSLQASRRGDSSMVESAAHGSGRAGSAAVTRAPPLSLTPWMPWQAILKAAAAAAAQLVGGGGRW